MNVYRVSEWLGRFRDGREDLTAADVRADQQPPVLQKRLEKCVEKSQQLIS